MATIREYFQQIAKDNDFDFGSQLDIIIMAHEERTGKSINDSDPVESLSVEERDEINQTVENAVLKFRAEIERSRRIN